MGALMWLPLALVFSFLGAGIIGFNHRFQVDGRALVVGRVLGVLPLAGLSWWLLPWPDPVHECWFYVGGLGMGVLLTVADVLLYDAAAAHGARLAALYIPIKTGIAFVVWLVLAGTGVTWDWRLPVVLAGFAGSGWALAHIRRSDASWHGLLAVVPVALLLAVGDVGAKFFLTRDGGMAALVGAGMAWLTMTNLSGAVVGGLLGGWPSLASARDRGNVRVAAVFGSLLYLSITLLLVTLVLAPNPGYVGAVTMLSAVWLALWARWRQGERNSLRAGLVLVACAMLIALVGAG